VSSLNGSFSARQQTLPERSVLPTLTSTKGCNAELAKAKVKTPILALGGDRGSAPDIYEAMKPLCEDIRGGVIKDCGHYIPEEQPEALAANMIEFFEQDGR
jgi:pimeloyl-ACP methyl ester carboxylesterase